MRKADEVCRQIFNVPLGSSAVPGTIVILRSWREEIVREADRRVQELDTISGHEKYYIGTAILSILDEPKLVWCVHISQNSTGVWCFSGVPNQGCVEIGKWAFCPICGAKKPESRQP